MEISGRLIQILPTQTGMGKNGEWKKSSFIIETGDKFPKKVCVVAWKDLVDQVQQIPVGSDVKAWKINASGGSSAASGGNYEAPMPTSEPPGSETDDLPF